MSIASYGIILLSSQNDLTTNKKKKWALICLQRNSFEYMNFIRGTWKTSEQLEILFSRMTLQEKDFIRNYTFDELWLDMWIQCSDEVWRTRAREKYKSIQEKIPYYLEKTEGKAETILWGFPKGRKNLSETTRDCALREFSEETRIPYSLLKEVGTNLFFDEIYSGTNGKIYSTRYFVYSMPTPLLPLNCQTERCIRKSCVSDEIGELKWVTFEHAKKYLHERRIEILRKAMSIFDGH